MRCNDLSQTSHFCELAHFYCVRKFQYLVCFLYQVMVKLEVCMLTH